MSSTLSFETQFQREINRVLDADRNARKRGLQKLFESIPWEKRDVRPQLLGFLQTNLIETVLTTVDDQVEKCREFSLKIIKVYCTIWENIDEELLSSLIFRLCDRLNDHPFPESAEELRLLILEVLSLCVNKAISSQIPIKSALDRVVFICTKALLDSFPSAKRAASSLLITLCTITTSTAAIRTYSRTLTKGLYLNAAHQHGKTRSLAVQAISAVLVHLGPAGYEAMLSDTPSAHPNPTASSLLAVAGSTEMEHSVQHTLQRLTLDRTGSVRIALSDAIINILIPRLQQGSFVSCDYDLLTLLVLQGGEEGEVGQHAWQSIHRLAVHNTQFVPNTSSEEQDENAMDVAHAGQVLIEELDPNYGGDAEAILRSTTAAEMQASSIFNDFSKSAIDNSEVSLTNARSLLSVYLSGIMERILTALSVRWTEDSLAFTLQGLSFLITQVPNPSQLSAFTPALCQHVFPYLRAEEEVVRTAALKVCQSLGQRGSTCGWADYLLPIINDHTNLGSPGDLGSRLRAISGCLQGAAAKVEFLSDNHTIVKQTMSFLVQPQVLRKPEFIVREGIFLALRAALETATTAFDPRSQEMALLYLSLLAGTQPNANNNSGYLGTNMQVDVETQTLQNVSRKLLQQHVSTAGLVDVEQYFRPHFPFLLSTILTLDNQVGAAEDATGPEPMIRALCMSVIAECPTGAWDHWPVVLEQLLARWTSVPNAPSATEDRMLSYAAQRGDESDTQHAAQQLQRVELRLQGLALLDLMLRHRSSSNGDLWSSGQAAQVLQRLLMPNLIWRVGRAEAAVRKVALAALYAQLRALPPHAQMTPAHEKPLVALGGQILPRLVDFLDDDAPSTRLLSCLGLSMFFQRAPGRLDGEGVRQIYPKLLARLDDAADEVRIAVCSTFTAFLSCPAEGRAAFTGTVIDYSLDQFFVHLDDPQPAIQQAVMSVIQEAAKVVDVALVVKKAKINRLAHRSTLLCDQLLREFDS